MRITKNLQAVILFLSCVNFLFCHKTLDQDFIPGKKVVIGKQAMLPDNPRSHYARYVNDAPVDGETLNLNPPRFRWKYHPDGSQGGLFQFVFQISSSPVFDRTIVDDTTPFNFYNTIAPLKSRGPFYWRVGYIKGDGSDGREPYRWSPVRSFMIAEDAEIWDRSILAKPDFTQKPHPRIILSDENRTKLLQQVRINSISKEILTAIRLYVDEIMKNDWYINFPASDKEPVQEEFYLLARGLCYVAFMYRLTGEEKYASVKSRALTLASYPRGGLSSPEPMGESGEDATQVTEFLALLYDWLYPVLTAPEKKVFINSLEWRIDHFVNNFAWKRERNGRRIVTDGSLSTICASHSFEGFWDTFPAALAIYEDSDIARECFHLGVNWMVGVSSSHGFDEGWNEGPSYSNSKFKWLLNALIYLDSVFPEFKVSENPWLQRIGEWFCRVTPVGIKYAPWGHGSNDTNYFLDGRINNFRRLAYLTNNGILLHNWMESGGKEKISKVPREQADSEVPSGHAHIYAFRLWIEFFLTALYESPEEKVEKDPIGFFPLAGWVMAGTKPPSTRECYETSVGMIFQCRPLGGYGHSFANENSFHIYGYGEDLTFGAGTNAYGGRPHAFHTMSHNSILIDGLGQSQPGIPETPRVGYIRAFQRGNEYVYWAGDAANAYPKHPLKRSGGWWGRLDPIYNKRDVRYLTRFIRHVVFLRGKYFIIFDYLASEKSAQYSWLYHILPHNPITVNMDNWTVDYKVGSVPVRIVHIANRKNLEFIDMKGEEGFKNPYTDEDYTNDLARDKVRQKDELIVGHNIYISNKIKAKEFHFLSVIAPVKPGEDFPKIKHLDDWTVEIDGDIISFNPKTNYEACLIIDVEAIRGTQPKLSPSWK